MSTLAGEKIPPPTPTTPNSMDQRLIRTLTITNWDALHDHDHDHDNDNDDRFFESFDRISSSASLSFSSSEDEDDDFDDPRVSFASAVSSVRSFSASSTVATPDYDVWMASPGSISERRKRLLQGMGLADPAPAPAAVTDENNEAVSKQQPPPKQEDQTAPSTSSPSPSPSPSLLPIMLVRSRSDGDIDPFSVEKQWRKQELVGSVSIQRITKTNSAISAPVRKLSCSYAESAAVGPSGRSIRHSGMLSSSVLSSSRFGAFFLIRNLDTGKEFIGVGYSPVVKELMRRENVSRISGRSERKVTDSGGGANNYSYITRSLRMISKRRGVALIKSGIRGVAHSMSGLICEKERETPPPALSLPPPPPQLSPSPAEQKPPVKNSNSSASSGWIKVRQSGKLYKELSALHLCQEIQAHEGSIWTIKFSPDARFLASAGEDRIVRVWEVQECEVMSLREEGNAQNNSNTNSSSGNGNSNSNSVTPLHPSFCASSDWSDAAAEKKKKWKGGASKRVNHIPDYVHVPETVFALSDKPVCSFKGHLDDVLDLSWSRLQLLLSSSMDKTVRLWDLESKSCLKLFAHNDYVTCIQFNPMNDDYFISGSLDAKVRIWSIPDRQVVDWTDLHEMVTAACYTPDGQGAFIGSHKGSCRTYTAEDCKLSQTGQIDFQTKKKFHAKKITGFQFSPANPSEVLVTSADSRIRIFDGPNFVHKFRGFRNTSSQIAASFTQDSKYVISASEDSQVYVWKREEHRPSASGKRSSVSTASYEQFQCKDVSVAIPWPGTIKGEPPTTLPLHSKRHSKRSSSQPPSACSSPTKEDISAAANSKKHLPPLPKKSATENSSLNVTEEELALVSQVESEHNIGESFNSDASSIRYGDSPSICATAATPSSYWSPSWSWFDYGSHGSHTIQATAWGMVIVTAGLGGEIRAYQNFGLPRKVGRQTSLFGGPT
ncbi:WD repeat-containing protein 44 [Morus notabilis]|uniref:WD repeat-containing protein 44 n=1 Tax=Morus notabilis TaxID=981085 RepID=W9SIJ9_9ROSA|nr:WD repeat-containing protein 44 [Morus notabilis]